MSSVLPVDIPGCDLTPETEEKIRGEGSSQSNILKSHERIL